MKKLIFTISAMLISSFTFSQTTVNIEPPLDDAWVYEANPNNNYGSSVNLNVGYDVNGDEIRTLIKWDLNSLPSCISIDNAQIRLKQWSSDGPMGGSLYAIAGTWNEGSVTWNNQPSTGNWYGTQTFSGAGLYFIPATDLLNDWLTNGNNGVMIKWSWGNNGEVPTFESKEESGADPRLIITYSLASPPSVNTSSTNTTCGDNNGSVTANASGGTPNYIYNWNNGCTTSTCSNLSAGTYAVTVTDANGCSTSGSTSVGGSSFSVTPTTINVTSSLGNTSFSISTNDSWTVSESCTWITNLSPLNGSGGGTVSFNYSENTSPSVRTCLITVTCGSSTETVTITQDPAPSCTSPTATVNDVSGTAPLTMSCSTTGGTGGSILYKWYSGTICSGTVLGTNSTLTVSTTGNYSCKAYINGFESTCNDCDFGLANITTGIEDIDFINNLSIYPNPNTGNFVIEMEITKVTDLKIKLLNVIGQVIYEEKVSKYSGTYKKEIDLPNIESGVYFLNIETKEGVIRKEISIIR